jgi:hypothetical protein
MSIKVSKSVLELVGNPGSKYKEYDVEIYDYTCDGHWRIGIKDNFTDDAYIADVRNSKILKLENNSNLNTSEKFYEYAFKKLYDYKIQQLFNCECAKAGNSIIELFKSVGPYYKIKRDKPDELLQENI